MKTRIFITAFLFVTSLFFACSHHSHTGAMPPGQAKKVTGSKSAKPYAPGQQKKS